MADQGRLTLDRLPYSMPPTSPLYPPPPIMCRDVESIMINFETDRDSAVSLLPTPLELADPPTGTLGILYIPYGAIGTYYESLMTLNCLWKGEPHRYDICFLVTNDVSMAFGREALGAPKKLGNVGLQRSKEGVYGWAERPVGHRLLNMGVPLEERLPVEQAGMLFASSICLRIIPQPNGAEPTISADLIQIPVRRQVTELWRGSGSISFPEQSAVDDWSVLPVNRITDSFYSIGHVEILGPRLLQTLK